MHLLSVGMTYSFIYFFSVSNFLWPSRLMERESSLTPSVSSLLLSFSTLSICPRSRTTTILLRFLNKGIVSARIAQRVKKRGGEVNGRAH